MGHYTHGEGKLGVLEAPRRNHYYYGKLLDELHFRMEQNYGNRKRWLHNQLSLGEGVLCGLTVTSQDGVVVLWPGVAVDGWGREITVPAAVSFDPWRPTDDCGKPGAPLARDEAHLVHICVAYHECPADFAPILATNCNTKEPCAPGTIVEGYLLLIEVGEPAAPEVNNLCRALISTAGDATIDNRRRSLCEATLDDCPQPSQKPCVCLATVELRADGAIGAIDNCSCRTVVYSNTALLELILCLAERIDACCGAPPVDTRALRYVSGDNQSAAINRRVRRPLTVRVLQSSQNDTPVPDEMVTFEVILGDGRVGPDLDNLSSSFQVLSDSSGLARLPVWVLGPEASTNQVRASISDGAPGEFIFDATAIANTAAPPVIEAIWPPNAAMLSQHRAWFSKWQESPHLEITFDRQMDLAQLESPKEWLRLWRVQRLGRNEILVASVGLVYAGSTETPILNQDGVTEVFRAREVSPGERGVHTRYLVQMRADAKNIVDTSEPPLLLDAEFDGTDLTESQLEKVWEVFGRRGEEVFEQEVWDAFVDTMASLPASGDGAEGGLFHSWFEIRS